MTIHEVRDIILRMRQGEHPRLIEAVLIEEIGDPTHREENLISWDIASAREAVKANPAWAEDLRHKHGL